MTKPAEVAAEQKGLCSYPWRLSYKTSSTVIDGRPVNILHDFYIPALRLAVRYDRVAGYFRSSSLAAASQGFSTFVGRQGKMRLIVGADLEPDDVKAILAGDKERLAARLNGELEHRESWPEGVQSGVTLLAWMVAHGYLEVRVAFRVHRETGEPLPLDAVDDGYVHEKWFILYDQFGHRLYGAGTLNESRTALVLNAENIDVHCDWWGERDRRRVDEAAAAFDKLWMNQVPHMPVLTLPEAVHRRLIRLAEGVSCPAEVDGSTASPKPVRPPSALERLQFAVLRDGPKLPGGRLVGMETAPVAPWPHQAVVVRRLVGSWPFSYLLCDEVGLGKTIEAGLAFRSLYLSGLVKRILVAAPASLTRQWHRQMASRVLLPFGRVQTRPDIAHEYIWPTQSNRPATSIYEPDLVIMSTGLLARQERAQALQDAEAFDIALVDEAHALRRRNPAAGPGAHPDYGYLYSAVRDFLRPKARSLWLATATPMQIDPVEVCDLLALTNRAGAFQFDPSLTLQYYEVLGRLVRGEGLSEQEWDFLRRAVQAVQTKDPVLWRFIERNVIDGRIRDAVRKWLKWGDIPKDKDQQLISRLLFGASPLSRVMLRHTRKLLEIYQEKGQLQQKLPRRHLLPMPRIMFTPSEKKAYEELEDYCKGLAQQMAIQGNPQNTQMLKFLLSFLRLRFASSLYAIRETLKRRLRKVEATLQQELVSEEEEAELETTALVDLISESEDEDDKEAVKSLLENRTPQDLEWERSCLQAMIEGMANLNGPSSKMQELLRVLDRRRDPQSRRIRQTVVFTRFYDTLTDIVARLRQVDPQMRIGTYSGQGSEYFEPGMARMVAADREEVKERFLRGEIDVLVCTDAAAEGLNLQTADLLINFDLGWNPMKVEQRIGRIDRIGQIHDDIFVLNLCYSNSAEEVVYGRLLKRLADANLIVGTQQISLLPVEPEEFAQLAEGTLTPEELEARARRRIEEQRRRTESMEMRPEELYEIYMRMGKGLTECGFGDRQEAPVDLAAIWEVLSGSEYLRQMGCVVQGQPHQATLTLSGIQGVPDGAVLTISRELYEQGLGDQGPRVHFASYGEPYFDAILEQLGRFELPACVRRIAVPIPVLGEGGAGAGAGAELVGYAVACRGSVEGEAAEVRQVKLVKSFGDLRGLVLDEATPLREEEIAPLREELQRLALQEFQFQLVAQRIESDNFRAAQAQVVLDLLVIHSLLGARARFAGEGALFSPVAREVESLFADRRQILVNDLPARLLRPVVGELLFDCRVPTIGDQASVSVSKILARAALDAASRVADSLKVRKGELRVNAVLSRLKREAEAIARQWQ